MGLLDLIGIFLIKVHTAHVLGVQAQESRVGDDHVARVPTGGHALKVAVLDRDYDVLANTQLTRYRSQVSPLGQSRFLEHAAKADLVHVVPTSSYLLRIVCFKCLDGFQLHRVYQDFARLGPVRGAYDALFFKQVHNPARTRIANAEPALKIGGRPHA